MSKPRKLARWLWRRWTPHRHAPEARRHAVVDVAAKGPPPGKDLSWLDNLDARPERPSLEG